MNDHDEEIEQKLGIAVERKGWTHHAQFDNIPGVSIIGFGSSADMAVKSLLLRLVNSATSHMAKVQERLHGRTEELDVNIGWSWDKLGRLFVTITDPSGRRTTKQGPGKWK